MSAPDAIPDDMAQVLEKIVRIMNERKVAYALIGGLGVAIRGLIRATRDIDLLLKIPQINLPGILEALVEGGCQLDVLPAIEAWNRDRLLDFSCQAIRIDWLQPVLPAFERVLERARWEQLGDFSIRVADAEGLLLLKLIAFRPRDQEDIKGILATNRGRLDLDWVRNEWVQIVGNADPKTEQFEQLVHEFYA